MGTRRRFDREYKLHACRLVVEQGYTTKEAAERLRINAGKIRDWIKKYSASGDLPPTDQLSFEAKELERLRKEIKQLQLENAILKKAVR
jgi:transposase